MAINGQVIKVNITNSTLRPVTQSPVTTTLRNTRADYNEIKKLNDIDLSALSAEDTLIYNESTQKFEAKSVGDALAVAGLDGGTF